MQSVLAVTGIGLTTSLGTGIDENWRALAAGRSGIRPLASFDVSGYPVKDGGEALPPGPAGEAEGARRAWAIAELAAACREALTRAGLAEGRAPSPSRAALVVGSSLAAAPGGDLDPTLETLSRALDVRGETVLVSNACAAGASSLALAADLLRTGRADLAIAAGYDTIALHTFAGFGSLKALAEGATRPFAAARAGMKLGDGFAAAVLEPEGAARRAGRRPLARFLGYGESSDAHHLTHPDPEGRGAALAMRRALAMAGIGPDAIDYVNVHGTATASNDEAEFRAMRAVFGERVRTIPLGASKPALGHTLGAAGTVEAVVTLLVLANRYLPPTVHVGEADPAIGPLDLVPEARPAAVRVAMSNSFGFGGCNASVVFGEAPDVS